MKLYTFSLIGATKGFLPCVEKEVCCVDLLICDVGLFSFGTFLSNILSFLLSKSITILTLTKPFRDRLLK